VLLLKQSYARVCKPNNMIVAAQKRFAVAVTVVPMSCTPGSLDAAEFKDLLADCQTFPEHRHSGSVYFDAARVAARLATHSGHDPEVALWVLERWTASVGGQICENGLLRLSAVRFGDGW
jgi:hypothetical protein